MNPLLFWISILSLVVFRVWHHRKHLKQIRAQDEIILLLSSIEDLMLTLLEIRRAYPETYICMHTYQDRLQHLIVLFQRKCELHPRPSDKKILRGLQSELRLRLN